MAQIDVHKVDVVILTAADGEPEGVRAVAEGRLGDWREETDPPPHWPGTLWRADFRTPSNRPLSVVLAKIQKQGPEAAANACGQLAPHYLPQCLAMAGVCAGKPGKTYLGDVVLAQRLYRYDQGAQIQGADGLSYTDHDVQTYELRVDWKGAAERLGDAYALAIEEKRAPDWLKRPPSFEVQGWWILNELQEGRNPLKHPQANELLPHRPRVLEALKKRKHISLAPLTLTEKGRKALAERTELLGEELLAEPRWELRIGPMGTGEKLVRDPKIWGALEHLQRHSIALEMEGSAIGYSQWVHNIPRCLVVKGVMDHADPTKGNDVRAFAARASAEVLLRFLRENLLPQQAGPGEILVDGISVLPEDPQPSHLLTARYRVIEFQTNLAGDLHERLEKWVRGDQKVSVRLFTAPGGAGKTRHLLEFALDLRDRGWDAGFLLSRATQADLEVAVQSRKPTLLILDYAESHPKRAQLLRLAVQQMRGRTAPLRIALLARNAGDWWDEQRRGEDWIGLLDHPPIEVPRVNMQDHERAHFLSQARADLALWVKNSQPETALDLSDPRFGRPLYIAVAAYAQLEGLPTGAERVLEHVLEHEIDLWARRWPACKIPGLELFLAAVTLRGGLPSVENAEALADALQLPSSVLQLRSLYSGSVVDPRSRYLAPLEPDLLGETLVASVLENPETHGNYLVQVFAGTGPEEVQHGLTVLGRLEIRLGRKSEQVKRWVRDVLETQLATRAVPAMQAVLSLGGEALSFTLAEALCDALQAEGNLGIAMELEHRLPPDSLALQEVAVWAYQILIDADNSKSLNHTLREGQLALHLAKLGRHEEACKISKRLVQSYRTSSFLHLDKEGLLASSLNSLANRYSELGKFNDALLCIEEAVAIRKRLVVRSPSVKPQLATSLSNMGSVLHKLGRVHDAIGPSQEAAEIKLHLSREQPDVYLPGLAISYNNLGTLFGSVGNPKEALRFSQLAADIYQKLSDRSPDIYLPDLVKSLNNLAVQLQRIRRIEDAVPILERTVAIYRILSEKRPDVYRVDLASCLSNLGNAYRMVNLNEKSLGCANESLQIYRVLSETDRMRFGRYEATSLINIALTLGALERFEEALIATQSSVDMCRPLAAKNPEGYSHLLATGLNNVSLWLNALGRLNEVRPAIDEANAIFRQLASIHPETPSADLATSLMVRCNVMRELDPKEAFAACRESLDLFTLCFELHPDAYSNSFLETLNSAVFLSLQLGIGFNDDEIISGAIAAAKHHGVIDDNALQLEART